MMHGVPNVVRTGYTLERLEKTRLEGLRPERHARYPSPTKSMRELEGHRLRVGFDRHFARRRQSVQQPYELGHRRECRRTTSEEDRLEAGTEERALELQLAEECVDVGAVLPVAADDGDEVAVAATVRAKRQVHVQVAGARHAPALLGRETSSPLQFGQTRPMVSPQARQNVHS
jgi:hypothetical protein